MRPLQDNPFPEDSPTLNRRRFDAALAYQGRTLNGFAAALGRWCARHVALVIEGKRVGSAVLLRAIREELGEPGWMFATGQADTLGDEGGDRAQSGQP